MQESCFWREPNSILTSEEDKILREDHDFSEEMTVRMNRRNMYMKTLQERSVAVIQMVKWKLAYGLVY